MDYLCHGRWRSIRVADDRRWDRCRFHVSFSFFSALSAFKCFTVIISDVVHKVTKYKLRCKNRSNGTYQDSDYLYVDEEGNLLHVSTITNRWCKWLKKHSEVQNLNFHALRHTYCSLMLSYDIDPRALADLMGHANPIISLNTYSHSYMETKLGYVQTLNKALYASADA